MKTSFRILSLVLLLATILAVLAACEFPPITDGSSSTTEKPLPEWQDYASQLKLDTNSSRLRIEVTVHQFIDGDTTHFNVPKSIAANGVLKARYIAINTPESTGAIEEWGKAASTFTRSQLEKATSIILESDTSSWNLDSTGDRHLVWVWYKTAEMSEYRNLNLEILQNGLAIASNSSQNSYGTYCMNAINQAKAYKLYVYSDKIDPDFYYGDAIQVTLRELATNPAKYLNMTVAFEGVVVKDDNGSIYVEDYCEETGMYHGMTVFKGYNLNGFGLKIIEVGNRVKIVGSMQFWEGGGIFQVSDLDYDPMEPDHPDNQKLISTGHSPAYVLTTPKDFCTKKLTLSVMDEEGNEIDKEFSYAELALNTTIEMKNLTVVKIYTTNNGGDSDGAMTLTCKSADGYEITVRTNKMIVDGKLVTADAFKGKTIDVKGLVGYYNGSYQIKLLSMKDVVIH